MLSLARYSNGELTFSFYIYILFIMNYNIFTISMISDYNKTKLQPPVNIKIYRKIVQMVQITKDSSCK